MLRREVPNIRARSDPRDASLHLNSNTRCWSSSIRAIVHVRAVVLIALFALFALVRRFIVLYQTSPSTIAALAGASFARGVVFWIVGSKEEPQAEEAEQ